MSDKIEKVKEFCEAFDKDGAVIFFVDDREMGYASYGKDKEWCNFMRQMADILYDFLESGILKLANLSKESKDGK